MKKLMIIGNGIAANALKFYVRGQFEIIQVASSAFAPACSLSSTAIVALRQTQKGMTELGDVIHDSFFEFQSFIKKNKPAGVEKVKHFQIWDDSFHQAKLWDERFSGFSKEDKIQDIKLEKQMKVYTEDAYLIYPEQYLHWFKGESETVIDDYIESFKRIDSKLVAIGRKQNYKADFIVCCCGAFFKFLSKGDDRVDRTKPIQGSYLVFDFDYPQSFSMTIQKVNVIYRKQTKELLIGSTSDDSGFDFCADKDQLNDLYSDFTKIAKIDLPPISQAKIQTGLRHKGVKRKPYWGKTQMENIFTIDSLYKNGWSYSSIAAKELAVKLTNLRSSK